MINSINIYTPSFIQDNVDNIEDDTPAETYSVQGINFDFDYIMPTPHTNVTAHATTTARAQLDTGAEITCTNLIQILHDYKPYDRQFPCNIRLTGAVNTSKGVYPLGEGTIHIPAENEQKYCQVRCIYSPHLTTTLVNEDDILRSNPTGTTENYTTALYKHNEQGTMTLAFSHAHDKNLSFAIHGTIDNGKCYTQPLLLPHNPQSPLSPDDVTSQIAINAIKAKTERLLWHQRLGHPSDEYLFNAHKHIIGVPKFKHEDRILEKCPTCIRSKQTKNPAGPNTIRKATEPFQGLSIDFAFSGVRSKNDTREQDYVGLNGEKSWILISDHYTRYLTGDTKASKGTPIGWLQRFLETWSPKCNDKYVCMDQGGELYNNPEVRTLFTKYKYKIRPTGADASHQNGPVERAHRTIANKIRCMLTGADLPAKFWPYAFHHAIRLLNALPSRTSEKSPVEMITSNKEDFRNLRTFGSRVWVRPPGRRTSKLQPNSRKGIFLGFLPNTTRNILWYDIETERVKISAHARFDEGMNDLPTTSLPPNATHLQRSENDNPIDAETDELSNLDFNFYISPFDNVIPKTLKVACRHPTYGFDISQDEINGRAFLSNIKHNTSASKLYSSTRATRNKIKGSFIISIDGNPVFNKQSVLDALRQLRTGKRDSFEIEFALEPKMYARELAKNIREHDLFRPDVSEHDLNPTIDTSTLRAISAIRTGMNTSPEHISTDIITTHIRAIQSQSITPEEQTLGKFTRRKLKKLNNWTDWEAGERKQLDQFHDLGMFGTPTKLPKNGILLRPHWQYSIRKSGERRSRNCCDGSKRAAPLLHAIANTYSSCVEQPIQRMFFAICAIANLKIYAGDAKDAYAHSPPPEHPTYISIDDAYAEWYLWKFGKPVDRDKVLPVLHALQGHPEAGRLWEIHINGILHSKELNFKSTTHNKCIYTTLFNNETIYLLRQVDDFLLACSQEHTAITIYDIIGTKLRHPSESINPFKYLGLVTSYNGVDVNQHRDYIEITCHDYIERVASSHNWTEPTKEELQSHPTTPIPEKALDYVYATVGPNEQSKENIALQKKHGFSYRTLLGELLYAYTVCRPDIGFAITTLSKFASNPADIHFKYLKSVALYLRRTKHWGIRFRRSNPDNTLPNTPTRDTPIPLQDNLPDFPALPHDTTITCFVDAAYGNVKTRRKSTTGYAIFLAGAAIVYRSKTQTQTALSSTEAEFYAAVSAAKIVLYLRSVLNEIGFPQAKPTNIYEDNDSTIKIINSGNPTDRSRHIDIPYFAIQDWKREKLIKMQFVNGTMNPADVLTKPLGWVLHDRHARRLIGHFNTP